ncbi:MAG TPA: RIP metalloprotease RseP [Thermoanaerobaculia bacterium]|nr:RIP metalloprotease RseP [Thermoanaerobaculia bacterium]
MTAIGTNIVAFILVLGLLIFAHESGHFLLAKLFRVRVLVFSFGFGKRLAGFQKGDTDYRISLIPLGGYVRMAGDTPDEGGPIVTTGAPDEFLSKPKWQRLLILFAGPGVNILIAIVFLAALAMVGTESPIVQPVIAEAMAGHPAAKAGLQAGDRIVRIGGETIKEYEDLKLAIMMNADTPLQVEYIRNGHQYVTTMTPERENSDYGPVGRAGIRPRRDPIVGRVVPNTPAAKAGIHTGDRIVAVNGKPVHDMYDVDEVVAKSPDAPISLVFQRGAQQFPVNFPAWKFDERNPYRGFLPPTEIRKLSLGAALQDSVQQNLKMLRYAFSAVRRIFRAEGSVRELSGPISIARISGDMLRRGWFEVIALMAMISLQLGVMNLLPIPVLDGGHIAILLVEGAARRDLSLRAKERIQQFGFAVLAALMIVVLYNDVVSNVARVTGHG